MTQTPMPGLPNLVIAGVTKAGTTSLYRYLGQHPDVGVADVKEVDHYAPMVHGEEPPPTADYAAHFRHCVDAPWRLEASPRYFIGGPELIHRLAADLGRPKVMIAIREPVSRMWSSYTYKRSKARLPDGMSFAGFVDECQRVVDQGRVREPGDAAYRTLASGVYADYLGDWFDTFDDELRVVFSDQLARSPQTELESLCTWIGLDPAPVAAMDFEVRNATYQPRSQSLRRAAHRVNAGMKKLVDDDSAVKRALRSTYQRLNTGTLDATLSAADRQRVSDFYAPTLAPLRVMLRDRGYAALPGWLAPDASSDQSGSGASEPGSVAS